jgi:hypothetical protein
MVVDRFVGVEQRRSTMNPLQRITWRSIGLFALGVVAVWIGMMVQAQPPEPRHSAKNPGSEPPPIFTEEREAAALTFVRKHRPELVQVLNELKAKKRAEYQQAIRDLFRVSEALTQVRQDDPARYELAVKTWQAEMQAHLLASQMVRQPASSARIRTELEQAVGKLVDAQIAEMDGNIRHMESALERLRRHREELRSRRTELVRERVDGMLQAVQRHRSEQSSKNELEPQKPNK